MSSGGLFRSLLAPVISCAMLASLWLTSERATPLVRGASERYMAQAASAIDDLPYQIGGWIGSDIPITPAAVEMLRPNRLVHRRFREFSDSAWFDLLIVHSADVRDMIGHYPPVCYPAHGWDQEERRVVERPLAASWWSTADYSFSREVDLGRESIHIVSFFAVPSDDGLQFDYTMEIVERAARFRGNARRGAAQFQIVTPGDMPAADRSEIVDHALTLVAPVLEALGRDPV